MRLTPPFEMPTETAVTEWPAADLAGYTPAQVHFARAAWPMRAAQELRSALVFRALERAAREAGWPEPWPSRFGAAVRDEVRHARICAMVGRRLGAERPGYDARPVQARLGKLLHPAERAASLLLGEVAIGETVSMCLFRAARRATVEPLSRAVLSAIVHDEARHQRLGWSAVVAWWPSLGDEQRAFACREAGRSLASSEQQVASPAMRWLQEQRRFDPAYAALGVLHPEERIEAFYTAVEKLVVPRLTRLGLDGTHIWKERYRA